MPTEQRLRNRIAELEEEILQLRAAQVPVSVIPTCLKLTRQQANLLAYIYHQYPNCALYERIYQIIWPNDTAEGNIIHVIIHAIRRKCLPYNIHVHAAWGKGIYLDPTSKHNLDLLFESTRHG